MEELEQGQIKEKGGTSAANTGSRRLHVESDGNAVKPTTVTPSQTVLPLPSLSCHCMCLMYSPGPPGRIYRGYSPARTRIRPRARLSRVAQWKSAPPADRMTLGSSPAYPHLNQTELGGKSLRTRAVNCTATPPTTSPPAPLPLPLIMLPLLADASG